MESSLQSGGLCAAALRTVKQYDMLREGDRIAVGVSGGADSVALLTFLCGLRDEYKPELLVCHVNHCLRGAESDGDALFVRELAARHGLEYFECSFDAAAEAAKAGLGVEEYSRQRRYEFFERCAGEKGRIATAHTLSDSVETVLFNLIRGTGVRGLCGIPRLRGRIIRPLRDCTREQVEEYLTAQGERYRNDSTNSTDDYSRNYIRHNLIPVMLRLNPSLHSAIGRTADCMEQQWNMTLELAQQAGGQVMLSPQSCDRCGLLRQPEPVAALLLKRWLETAGVTPNARLLELMKAAAAEGRGAVELRRGVRFVADSCCLRLCFDDPAGEDYYLRVELPKKPGESTEMPLAEGKKLKITRHTVKNLENAEKLYNKDLKSLVECDKIKEPVFVHPPREQDTIFLQERRHSLIRRYRTGSKGYTSGQISRMAVLEDVMGTVWAQRLGSDLKRRPGRGVRELYRIEILEEDSQ